MKYISLMTVFLVFLMGALFIPLQSAAAPLYDKSVEIHINANEGKFTVCSTEMRYFPAPHLLPNKGDYTGVMVAGNGSVIRTFPFWDPRIHTGYGINNDFFANYKGDTIQYYNDTIDFVVTMPFDRSLAAFYLRDEAMNSTVLEVDLRPAINAFFSQYPGDPDNPAGPTECSARMSPVRPDNLQAPPHGRLPGPVPVLPAIGAGLVFLILGAIWLGWYRRTR